MLLSRLLSFIVLRLVSIGFGGGGGGGGSGGVCCILN